MDQQMLTIQQAARYLGVSPKTLTRWEERGILIPERTFGNQRRYSVSELEAFKNNSQKQPLLSEERANPEISTGQVVLPQATTSELIPMSRQNTQDLDQQMIDRKSFLPPTFEQNLHSSVPGIIKPKAQTFASPVDPTMSTTAAPSSYGHIRSRNRYILPIFAAVILFFSFGGLVLGTASGILFPNFFGSDASSAAQSERAVQIGTNAPLNTREAKFAADLLVNVPSFFAEKVSLKNDFVVDGKSLFNEDITVNNKNVDLGTGSLTASNVVYGLIAGSNVTISGDPQNPVINASLDNLELPDLTTATVTSLQGRTGPLTLTSGSGISLNGLAISNTGVLSVGGQTGDVTLRAGDGISVSDTTVTNDDRGSAQNIFKTVIVDGSSILANSNDDTLTFQPGAGIVLTTDTTTKTITITSNASGTLSGLSTNGVLYATSSNNATSTSPGTTGTVLKGVTAGVPVFGAVALSSDVTGTLPIGNGGTGVTSTPSNGQLLIGNGSGYTIGTLTQGSGITIGNGAGSISVTNNGVLSLAGTANQVNVSGATGAITLSLPQNIHTAATPTFASLNLTSNTNQLTLGSGNTGVITLASLTSGQTYTLPDASGEICLDSGNCPGGGGGNINGNGTGNYLAKFTGAADIGNSLIYDTGQKIGIGTISPQGLFSVSGASSGTALVSLNETGDQHILVGSASGTTRFVFDRNGNLNLTGGVYQIDGVNVLSATALGNNVVSSSLTSVATLNSGSISSGFGAIDVGTDAITGGNITASGATGFTASGNDADFVFSGSGNHLLSASSGVLQFGAATLTGAITGNNQTITGLSGLSSSGTITFGAFTSNGGILYTNAAGQLAQVTAGTSTQVLKGGATPTFGAVDLGTDVSGTLPVTNGGTGLNTVATGDLLYADSANSIARRSIGLAGQILTVQGGVPVWTDAGGTINYWQQGNGTIAPLNITNDLLLGGTATATAKFAFINTTGSAAPTASIAGTTTNATTYLNGNGVLGTTNAQTLTLGSASTGNIILDSGSGLITIADATILSSNLTLEGTALFNGSFTFGDNGETGLINTSNWDISTAGAITGTQLDIDGILRLDSQTLSAQSGDLNLSAADNNIVFANNNTFIIGGHAGNVGYNLISDAGGSPTSGAIASDNDLYVQGAIEAGTLYQGANQVCDFSGNCSGLNVNYWDQTNGVLAARNTTVDLLVGGTSTQSAKFAVLNINAGMPTASVSGATGATSIAANGVISTTNSQKLVLGSASNGDIQLSPYGINLLSLTAAQSSGNVNIGTSTLQSWAELSIGAAAGQNSDILLRDGDGTNTWGIFADIDGSFGVYDVTNGRTPMAIDANTPNDTFHLTAAGGASIGNPNPVGILDVRGSTIGKALTILNETGGNDIFTASASGITRFTIANNGNISLANYNNCGMLTTTGTVLTCSAAPTGTTYWQVASNTLAPGGSANATDKIVIGGNTTTPFQFEVNGKQTGKALVALNETGNQDIFTASAAGTTRFVINNNGNVGIGVTTPTEALDVAGDVLLRTNDGGGYFIRAQETGTTSRLFGSANSGTDLHFAPDWAGDGTNGNLLIGYNMNATNRSIGLGYGSANTQVNTATTTILAELSGTVGIGTANPLATLDVRGRLGTSPTASVSGTTSRASLVVDNNGVGDIFTASKSGATKFVIKNNGDLRATNYTTAGGIFYGSDDGTLRLTAQGNNGECLQSTGAGGAPVWGACGNGNTTNYWNLANGLLYNGNTTTDFAVGGTSTTSAKFLVSMNGTRPTASVSGNTSNAALLVDNTGSGALFAASSSGLTRFVITNAGNVGIGTTNPTSILELGGVRPISLSTANGRGDIYIKGDTGSWSIGYNAYGSSDSDLGGFNMYGSANTLQYYYVGASFNNPLLNILQNGTVGIGIPNANLNNPLATLDLRSQNGTLPVASISGQTTRAAIVVDNSGLGDLFTASKSGATKFVITNAGNVGIGTATPTTKLDINALGSGVENVASFMGDGESVNDTTITIGGINGGVGEKYITYRNADTTTSAWMSGMDDDETFSWYFGTAGEIINGATFMNLTQAGNLGIGTNSPLARLDVRGTANDAPVASVSGANAKASLLVDNSGGGDIFTASKSGATKFTILNSGNVSLANYNNCGMLTTTGTVLTCSSAPAGTNYWQVNSNTLAPGGSANATDKVVLGGVANTTVHQFEVNGKQTGKALVSFNETGNQAILTGSASGQTRFTFDNSGNLGIEGQLSDISQGILVINDDVQVNGNDILDSTGTTALSLSGANVTVAGDVTISGGDIIGIASTNLLNTTTTTLNFAGAATTLNIADAAITGTIDIGGVTADGASTVNIATNGTTADTITIGNSNASTLMTLTGGDDWSLSSAGVLTLDGTQLSQTTLSFSGAPTISSTGNMTVQPNSGNGVINLDVAASNGLQINGTNGASNGSSYDCVQVQNGIVTGTGACGTTPGTWTANGPLLYTSNQTMDVLFGGISSTSAVFKVSPNNRGPVASVSANTGYAAMVINNNSTGDLFTASKSGKTHFTIRNSGTVLIGNNTDGITLDPQNGGMSYSGNARKTKTISLQPEYSGATLTAFYGAGTDTNITGSLTSDIETSGTNNLRSYYQWERTTDATQHFYTVAVRARLPKDFSAWATSNAIQVDYVTESATSTNSDLDVRVYIDNDASLASTDAESLNNTSTSWSTISIDDSSLNEVDAADETAVIYLRMGSASSFYVRIGEIRLNYLASF